MTGSHVEPTYVSAEIKYLPTGVGILRGMTNKPFTGPNRNQLKPSIEPKTTMKSSTRATGQRDDQAIMLALLAFNLLDNRRLTRSQDLSVSAMPKRLLPNAYRRNESDRSAAIRPVVGR